MTSKLEKTREPMSISMGAVIDERKSLSGHIRTRIYTSHKISVYFD